MGGNGAYCKTWGGIPHEKRSHIALPNRIDGHKILLQGKDPFQRKFPMNSNSENPIYLCASTNLQTGVIKISSIAIYDKHRLIKTIDLEFDTLNNILPYKNGKGSHMHLWEKNEMGDIGRRKHNKKNIFPIPKEFQPLINKIETYNKQMNTWKRKN